MLATSQLYIFNGANLRIVTTSAECSVSTVLVGDPLELLGTLDQVLEFDLLDQILLIDELGRLLGCRYRTEQAGTGDEQIEPHVDN